MSWDQRFFDPITVLEQAARAITGRLIQQLPARRLFHRTLLISAGPSPRGRAAVPHRAACMAGLMGRRPNPHDYRYAKT